MAAAVALVIALEAVPGVDHDATAMGLTAALVLLGASLPSGLMLRERERRHRCRPFPRPLSQAFVVSTGAIGFGVSGLFSAVALALKSPWILTASLAVTAAVLTAAFAAVLGTLLGITAPNRRALGSSSVLAFVVLLVPVALCCGDALPSPLHAALSLLPTVALAHLMRAALAGGVPAARLAGDVALVLASTLLMALFVRQRIERGRIRRFAV